MGIRGADQEWATDSPPSLGLLLPSDPPPSTPQWCPWVGPQGWEGPAGIFPNRRMAMAQQRWKLLGKEELSSSVRS